MLHQSLLNFDPSPQPSTLSAVAIQAFPKIMIQRWGVRLQMISPEERVELARRLSSELAEWAGTMETFRVASRSRRPG